jgi:hypothetical protein
MFQLVGYGFFLLVAITVIASGTYIGALRALDVYFGGEPSIFLSDERREVEFRE